MQNKKLTFHKVSKKENKRQLRVLPLFIEKHKQLASVTLYNSIVVWKKSLNYEINSQNTDMLKNQADSIKSIYFC